MGKGDKKTAKGKRVMGSYGVTRQKKKDTHLAGAAGGAKTTDPVAAVTPAKTAAKPAAKKPAAEKTAAPKKTTKKEA